MDDSRCPKCNSDSLATVLSMDDSGERVLRSYCPACGRPETTRERAALLAAVAIVPKVLVYGGILLAEQAGALREVVVHGDPLRVAAVVQLQRAAARGRHLRRQDLTTRPGARGLAEPVVEVQQLAEVGVDRRLVDQAHASRTAGISWRSRVAFSSAKAGMAFTSASGTSRPSRLLKVPMACLISEALKPFA